MNLTINQDILARLNQEQKLAVIAGWGPALVIAGAGSGKTTVLTRRITYLITELGCDASSILAVTFTNKAASEMKSRVIGLIGESAGRFLAIGTFHSVCARLLRQEIESYVSPEGYAWKRNFVIYDETDSLSLVKGVISRLNLDEKVFEPRKIRHAISALKNDGWTSSSYQSEAKSYKQIREAEIFTNYQRELARNNAFDFDDLIGTFCEVLRKNPEVQRRLRDQYRHVLVDEFQDTNQAQYELIRLLCLPDANQPSESFWQDRSLMVVGDVDQSIYSWRKADYKIILGFENDFKGAQLIKLEENYRSSSTILEVANSIIKNNTERIEKVLRSNRGQGAKARCYEAQDEIDESYYVVEELKRLVARGKSLADCVILYRTNAQSRALEEVLVRSHQPYIMVGATRFYDRQEIKDMIAYLKLIYNNQDSQSLLRVINTPRRGIGKTTLDKLVDYTFESNCSLFEAIAACDKVSSISDKTQKTLREFANMVARWQSSLNVIPISQLIELVLKDTRYLEKLEEEANAGTDELAFGRIENINEFVGVAREFESIADEPTLEAFLTRISLVSDLDQADMEQDAVTLMTLHSAKGLEFPIVFLMGLEEGLFPHIRSLNSPSALEEERRLMYVGVTRAADMLYLTYARQRKNFMGGSFGTTNYTIPSRFLKEITPDLMMGFYPSPEANLADAPFGSNSDRASTSGFAGNRNFGSGSRFAETSKSAKGMSREPAAREDFFTKPEPKETIHFDRLQAGDTVQHVKFGIGTITQVIGEGDKELYNVDFKTAGKRLMDPRFAKLVKLK